MTNAQLGRLMRSGKWYCEICNGSSGITALGFRPVRFEPSAVDDGGQWVCHRGHLLATIERKPQ